MVDTLLFCEILKRNGIQFYAGVPDSLLKDFCACISSTKNNIICANEGAAIGVAAGYYLSSGNIGLVYMQNSGLGNAVNPLVSLADPEVYNIPVLLVIGWRGEPGKKDEPQHIKQGKITIEMLNVLKIPYDIIDDKTENIEMIVSHACNVMKERQCPYALVIRENTFDSYKVVNKTVLNYEFSREDVIKFIIDKLDVDDIVVSTTGKTSREVFEYRELLNQGHDNDFLTVGSMGHASQIAMGIAINKPSKNIYCLDGDGAALMHMGSMAIIGSSALDNYKHIIINNGAHDSVGGQPTVGFDIQFTAIAKACGYKNVLLAEKAEDIQQSLDILMNSKGTSLLEIRVKKGARKDLGRPTTTPIENKEKFMEFLKK
ncbi:phosphonopyruvate decarboxylase [Pelosinus fermentans A11]|uniref:Phosphonopyruvate decarboxylase n=1 Tax=Pelosinus fermentans B4 TaxID=1149862 RepID=I8RKW6_9FIRM|nr:phosphonopyruvate decarboxylase [Pelosinus fermentans]EIW20928.1 phosphonopyruvate decarboxylase [Pelosinus fermentans B4]EIW27205.1 phosphonopyruvate decarboxylase [Pelosinus fermentans A11]